MAELSLNQKWFAILRATRAAAARNPAPQQQPPPEHEPETEYKTYDEEEEAAANADKDEIPEAGPTDDAEPKIAPEDVGDSENAAPASSRNNDRLAQVTAGIKAASNYVANKLTDLATQARNATLNAVNKFGQLGFIGTAKALGAWIKLHPWETALIVVPLVALIFIVIALSATGFGSAGIVAGSAAAAIHAGIGSVVAGSIFATCTSAMMGGYGALIVFGGVWLGSTVLMVVLAAAWKRWKSQSQRALVLLPKGLPKPVAGVAKQAASDAVFWTIVAAAYAVYRFKSWYRGHTAMKTSADKTKAE